MKVQRVTWISALVWAALTAIGGRGEWPSSWLALGALGLAPLAMCLLAVFFQRPRGLISAIDAEQLVWSQAQPPRPPMSKGRPIETVPPARQLHPLAACQSLVSTGYAPHLSRSCGGRQRVSGV